MNAINYGSGSLIAERALFEKYPVLAVREPLMKQQIGICINTRPTVVNVIFLNSKGPHGNHIANSGFSSCNVFQSANDYSIRVINHINTSLLLIFAHILG